MPIYKKESYGDLFIRFNLVIPKSLNFNQLIKFKEIFENEIVNPVESSFTYLMENMNDTDLEDLIYSSDSDLSSETSISGSESDSSVSSVSSEEVTPRRISKKR